MYSSGIAPIDHESHLQYCLEQLAAEVNRSNLQTIYTYTGDETHTPVYYEETGLFKKMLDNAKLKCKLVEVSDARFSPLEWDPNTSLLYIPGARSSELDQHIGSKVEEIKEFVNRGGKFLGWCGGGYWACRKVHYRMNAETTLHKIRNLAFWKGVEEGPFLPSTDDSRDGIEFSHGAVKVKWEGSEELKKYLPDGLEVNVLLSGGGSFIPAEDEHAHKVLAVYGGEKKEKSFAGVKTYVGKGIAILINPYFTHGAEYLKSGVKTYKKFFPQHNWNQIVCDLEGASLKSAICFVDLLLEATKGQPVVQPEEKKPPKDRKAQANPEDGQLSIKEETIRNPHSLSERFHSIQQEWQKKEELFHSSDAAKRETFASHHDDSLSFWRQLANKISEIGKRIIESVNDAFAYVRNMISSYFTDYQWSWISSVRFPFVVLITLRTLGYMGLKEYSKF